VQVAMAELMQVPVLVLVAHTAGSAFGVQVQVQVPAQSGRDWTPPVPG
jgi:hypothetical protein